MKWIMLIASTLKVLTLKLLLSDKVCLYSFAAQLIVLQLLSLLVFVYTNKFKVDCDKHFLT